MLYKVVLTFKSVNEIPSCDHLNENYWVVLSCDAVYYVSSKVALFFVPGDTVYHAEQSSPRYSSMQICCTYLSQKKLTCFHRLTTHSTPMRSHVEHTVGRSVEVRFISMSITSQLQYLGVSWEMQTAVNIGTIIRPDRAQYSLKCLFQIDTMTV